MKSRTRSRSVATSGLGMKSIGSSSSLVASNVAGEELTVLLEQPRQSELRLGGEFALEDRGSGAGQLRRHGQEQLVDQAPRPELGVKPRPALAEQRPDPALPAQ